MFSRYQKIQITTDVPRPLTNDLWVFTFQTIYVEWVKWASPAGTYVYVEAFIVETHFARTTYQYCK